MPENLEPSSLTSDPTAAEQVDTTLESEIQTPDIETPEAPAEKLVPLSELIDERHARQLAQSQLGNLQTQQIMLQQQIMEMKQSLAPKGQPVDPEIQKLLEPYIAPLQDQLRSVTAQAQAAQAALEMQQKVAYIQQHLPNFDSLGPEIAKEIKKMEVSEQEVFLANPRAIVRLGKMIEKEQAGSKAAATKAVARAAGRTETGATAAAASASDVNAETDWMGMSAEAFNSDPRVKAMFG